MVKELTQLVTDKYARHARLYPALVTALPASLLLLALAPALPGAGVLGDVVVASGLPLVAMDLARSKGRKLQPNLYREWGAQPSTILLRFINAANPAQVRRWHERLQRLVGAELTIPSEADEQRAPLDADNVYDTAVAALREATRDKVKFDLVFNELCSYGFRRNLLGLKPIALTLAALSLGATAGIRLYFPALMKPGASAFVAGISLVAIVYWLAVIRKAWVKDSAFTYAQTLLAALEKF